MALPTGFNSFEHLQDTWRKVHNRRVAEHFSDLAAPGNDWDETIETPRGALRVAATMRDDDTGDMTIIRTLLFWVVLGEAAALQVPVYGIPTPSFQEARKFRPQVQLLFQEDHQDVELGYTPVTGEISFRLMDETSETMTEAEATTIANRIKTNFGSGNRFVWRKGKVMCSYTDRSRGYQLQLLCLNKAEGRRVVEQVLDIRGHSPDWKFMNVSENEESTQRFPTIPSQERIFGKNRRLPRQRPTADVRFQNAVLHLWGISNPIVLVDYSGTYRNPLVAA